MTDNPLLDFSGLPRFDLIRPEHVRPALTRLLDDGRALVERLTGADVPATWHDFAEPLADGIEQLSRAWGVVGHLHSVNDVPPWREAYNDLLPEVTRFYSELGQNLALFSKYKALAASTEYATLSPARKRIVDNEIRDFRLSGAELPDEQKPRFQALQEEAAALAAKFSENLLDATNAHAEVIADEKHLAGLPDDVIEVARASAEKASVAGWRFTLHAPSYGPVMQYADQRGLRARMYRAYATRASEFGKPELDNAPLIHQLLKLRAEEAKLLGYRNFAEVSLVPKMAESPQQVLDFLRELARKAKPFAEKDVAELRAFARDTYKLDPLEPWDMAWVSEKLLQQRYAFSEQEVKQYFTEPTVLAGLFRVVETLFSVKVKPDTAPVWHEDVRFFRIENRNGELVGQFYLDLYAREEKKGGAWMNDARSRRAMATGVQTPVAYLVCNFSRPVGGKPATFTHDEVTTLFHETGHGLHHMLTRVGEPGVSGIEGVEWDAVELPSQFMENYCWEWAVLKDMTAHVDTGEALPRELFDKMLAARNFLSGMQTVRQIEFSLFDLLLHNDFDPDGDRDALQLLEEVRNEVAVVFPPDWHRFPNSFSHIFAGGYAAGYYSYKWAEVLSADCYAAFEEAGNPFDPETGRRFLDEILSVGGVRSALDSFRAFRGRDPSPDALLRHSGMIAA
ncbi:M3 family metallopeptidase [Azospira restricta]|uniref:oligopeptidase A n=1 Tax=Azospira restricta TaxID=404405 RepID=A0A974SP19_9RHOO|nr:M3 family metallopeptidase [Azospira restricta]QRJ63842.1 M3 family metallopeptidase [Azospira restricta]